MTHHWRTKTQSWRTTTYDEDTLLDDDADEEDDQPVDPADLDLEGDANVILLATFCGGEWAGPSLSSA